VVVFCDRVPGGIIQGELLLNSNSLNRLRRTKVAGLLFVTTINERLVN